MNVVQINSVYNIASTGRTTAELHNALVVAGHESYVVCTQTNIDAPESSFCMGTKLDRKLHGLLSRLFDDIPHMAITGVSNMHVQLLKS